jgi:hypothetical protein
MWVSRALPQPSVAAAVGPHVVYQRYVSLKAHVVFAAGSAYSPTTVPPPTAAPAAPVPARGEGVGVQCVWMQERLYTSATQTSRTTRPPMEVCAKKQLMGVGVTWCNIV